ncbi:hypothetical protein SEA_ATUIN_226 [Arthrobacter phage Atuin]|nr:hypothetical protein SEA_ATUIN_25 [Arthrobacter phage Atuin]
MSNLAKTLKGIKERSALAPRDHKIVNRDQLDALRESPEDVRTLLAIVDNVLEVVRENPTDHAVTLFAMEDAVRPDLILTEQQEDGILEV